MESQASLSTEKAPGEVDRTAEISGESVESKSETAAECSEKDDTGCKEEPAAASPDSEGEPDDDLTVDEVGLKETEENLTDEEKLSRKEEAQKLKNDGNELFKAQDFHEASKVYTQALRTCPLQYTTDRSVLYSNRAACRQHLSQNDDAIEDSTKAVELNPAYVKARLRRAQLYEGADKLDESLEDYKKVVEFEPAHREAQTKIRELPGRIQERNEKMKAEMIEKLKDLGNLVLRPFGLSTENFKLQQDPATGGYSVNFQQNQPQK